MANNTSPVHDGQLSTVSEKVARFFGVVFILLGLFLILFLIGGFIISKLPYRVDPNLPIPTLKNIDTPTNKTSIDIPGTVLPGEEIVLYIDDSRYSEIVTADKDGRFEFINVPLEEEGDVRFEAAVVRGGLLKRRSELSNILSLVVDWTPPSTSIAMEYSKDVTTDTTTVSGTAEPNSIVVLENESGVYLGYVDADGTFTITDLPLIEGTNTFAVKIRDTAGNEVITSDIVEIAYAVSVGDLNGPGVTIGPDGSVLPESSGELAAALEFLAGNNAMSIFGLIALATFGASSALVMRKARATA